MGKFWETYYLPGLNQEEIEKSEQTDYSKEVESIITSLLESGENGYMYMYVEHFAVYLKLSQHC